MSVARHRLLAPLLAALLLWGGLVEAKVATVGEPPPFALNDEAGRIHRIFDHYILPADFKKSVREIVEEK